MGKLRYDVHQDGSKLLRAVRMYGVACADSTGMYYKG